MELEDLIAYIKGDDTLKVEIEAWAEKDRANADELKKLSLAEYAMRLKGREGDYDAARALGRLRRKLAVRKMRFVFRAAAAMAIFATGGLIMYLAGPVKTGSDMVTLSSNKDKKVEITLPDGTLAYLNSNSSITFPLSFKEADQRRVKLVGEAYFEASHDEDRPLIIETEAGVEVTDLGTRFNVQAFKSDTVVQVMLLEGKVRADVLRSGIISDSNILVPGDHFSYNTKSGDISLVNRSSVSGIEWMDNKLVFSDTPLGEVARQLSHAMDVRFRMDPSLSRLRFSGTFENRDMDTILSYIEQTCGARSHKNAGEIILTKK